MRRVNLKRNCQFHSFQNKYKTDQSERYLLSHSNVFSIVLCIDSMVENIDRNRFHPALSCSLCCWFLVFDDILEKCFNKYAMLISLMFILLLALFPSFTNIQIYFLLPLQLMYTEYILTSDCYDCAFGFAFIALICRERGLFWEFAIEYFDSKFINRNQSFWF